MEDNQILDLYFAREEQAIRETQEKYGGYCYSIAYNILENREDAEESVSDTYLAAWNAMPPRRPSALQAFLGKITRNSAIDRWRKRSAFKRTGGELTVALEELKEVAGDSETPETQALRRELARELTRYLENLDTTRRGVFLCRYWYLDSVGEIAEKTGFSQSKIHSMLHKMRMDLKKQLVKEGLL